MTNQSIKNAFQLMWDYVLAKIPNAKADEKNKFLRGDGTWAEAGSEEFVVTFTFGDKTGEDGGYRAYATTCDRTFNEVKAALDAGKKCVGKIIWGSNIIDVPLVSAYSGSLLFGSINYTNAVGMYSCSMFDNGGIYGFYIFLQISDQITEPKPISTVLYSSSWAEQSDGTYAHSLSLSGVTANNINIIDCRQTGSDKDANIAILQGWGCVNDCKQAEGTLTFYCYGDIPTVNVPISVVVM